MKAQVITFDMVVSLGVFIVFMAIFIGVFFITDDTTIDYDFELDYVFNNLENNLKHEQIANNNDIDFYKNYRITSGKLDDFVSEYNSGNVDIDEFVIGSIEGAHGIGLGGDVYDACMYFVNDLGIIEIQGYKALGNLKTGSCHDKISANENPCDDYNQGISIFKPVLYDMGSPDNNKIIQMYLVMCRI